MLPQNSLLDVGEALGSLLNMGDAWSVAAICRTLQQRGGLDTDHLMDVIASHASVRSRAHNQVGRRWVSARRQAGRRCVAAAASSCGDGVVPAALCVGL